MDTQQEHIYNERIQEIFPLFDKIKKEDDPIYNARVDFNTVKFLTKHANWNWDEEENKNKAYGVILQECDKTKKAGQDLESEVKERLKEYVDDVAGVSIYGNHASITLRDNKKEFKISEFLNSDFCQKKGISGFSTLHSDGKSGMHGFVAEEGGKKIRHYVVTDGSYEMTLKWYAEGKECEIKIKIDANGVDLVKGDDFSLERLEANRDVKIGGLFLHEIEFREKGQGKANEMKESSETFIESNSRDIEQEVKKPVQMNLKDQSVIGGLFSHLPQQEVGFQSTISRSNSENGLGDKSQKEDSQKKRTPPPLPPRTSSLKKDVYDEQKPENPRLDRNEQTPNGQQQKRTPPPPPLRTTPKENVVNEQGRNASAKPVSQDGGQRDKQSNPTPNNQQKGATSDPSDSSAFTKSVSQDNRQKDERYDNPTFGHAIPGSQKPDRSEQTPNDQQQPKTQQQEGNNKGDLLQDIRNFKKNNLRHIDVDDRKASMEGGRKNESTSSILKTLKDKVPYLPYSNIHEHDSDNRDAEWEESKQPLSVPKPNSKSDSGYSPQIHAQPQVDPKQPRRSLENIEQSPLENLLKEIRDRSQQDNRGLRQVDSTDKLPQDKEDGLLKDSSTDIKANDSGYSSPTHANHEQSQVNPGQLKASLMNVEQRDDTLLTEFTSKLDKETQKFPLKPVDQKGISEQTKEHLLAAGLLKDNSTDIKTVAEQENNDTNSIVDKNSELYKLLEKDAAQLKAGVIEEERGDTLTEHTDGYDRNRIALANRNKRPLDWTKRIAESQQEKDIKKGISI
ncbi:hypothetical protein [Wolbachia endosymbiont of Oedothorax gibbosus]|uniref:hypothetical protein n=1 Tax=Wolbachia endosymbiont of Oedothorax gibbosus TaxID=931100 RepID=UPI0020256CA7|nr:hypothetical protein [Wolbachia endosymbiont of Oedothorax gibbosus]